MRHQCHESLRRVSVVTNAPRVQCYSSLERVTLKNARSSFRPGGGILWSKSRFSRRVHKQGTEFTQTWLMNQDRQ
jgi:hypothetical protein